MNVLVDNLLKAAHALLEPKLNEGGMSSPESILWDAVQSLEDNYADPRNIKIVAMARELSKEGEIEVDDDNQVTVSEGEDNGAYVEAWLWVSFYETELDKDKEETSKSGSDEPEQEEAPGVAGLPGATGPAPAGGGGC